MIIEQIYTKCLAQGAYYIESKGEIAIIDPLREVEQYIKKAKTKKAKIKYIFETHFHADFVSGHITLAKQTGAKIIYGPNANPSFNALIAKDGQVFQLGEITITALHTPGHTMESTTFLLKDKNGKDHSIFTGDTLFLGDVGRPDLAQKAANITQEDLAGVLYDSLRNKIMPLADNVTVYPAHGAGSACGKNMMKETVDTLGNQKKINYALRVDMTKGEFIKEVTEGLMPPPQYFPTNVKMNKEGYEDIDSILVKGTQALPVDEFEVSVNETGAIVLDVRNKYDFAKGHIPKSIFIGLDGDFAPWVGALIADVQQPILLVAPEGREEEAVTRLSRVGFDNALGFLKGGLNAWREKQKECDTLSSINPQEFAAKGNNKIIVIDVRKPNEYQAEHIKDAKNIPLSLLNDKLTELPKKSTFYIHCAGGYRSVIASSILKAKGMHNMINIEEGFDALKTIKGISKTNYVCPSTIR